MTTDGLPQVGDPTARLPTLDAGVEAAAMPLEPVPGGGSGDEVGGGVARPAPAVVADGGDATAPADDDLQFDLSALEAADGLSAAAAFVGCAVEQLEVVNEVLDELAVLPAGAALAELLEEHPDHVVGHSDGYGPPRWFPFDPRDPESPVYPLIGWFGFPDGSVSEVPLVVRLGFGQFGPAVEVIAAAGQRPAAVRFLAEFNRRRRASSPFRRRVLRASGGPGNLLLRGVDPPVVDRRFVVLPAGVWDQLDRHVVRFLTDFTPSVKDNLSPFGAHCGVLLTGPAGSGKTAVCRVLAAELAGRVTVVHGDPTTSREAIIDLYASLHQLAPALVILEHAEGAAPQRSADAPTALGQFLTGLDIGNAAPAPIVTILTTSEPGAIDGSIRQSSRIQLTIELGLPDATARQEILEVLLDGVDHRVDTASVAAATGRASGADLHNLVRLALLDGAPLTSEALLSHAAARGWVPGDTGLYL